MRHFSRYQIALSLIAVSSLACGILAVRMWWSGRRTYLFLVWNLFLAWIPYLASLIHTRSRRKSAVHRGLLVPATIVWLAFFPNAPYLVTDFIHLEHRPPVPHWFDIGLLVAFAWSGVFLAVFSLRNVHGTVERYTGRIGGWVFVGGSAVLAGLGAYMGRFLRWNSWDLAYRPHHVLPEITGRLVRPLDHPKLYAFSLLVGALLFACYLTVTAASARERV